MQKYRNDMNKKDVLSSLLYVAIIAMGIIFIINNARVLQISLYFVGGIVIAFSLYTLLPLIRSFRRLSNTPYRQTILLYIILLIVSIISGIAIIIGAARGTIFYQSALASIFFFRCMHRFFGCYTAKKANRNKLFVRYLVLACISLALAVFMSFYTGAVKTVGIVAGIALIFEGLLGLFDKWYPRFVHKTKVRDFSGNYARKTNSFSDNSYSEIIITDYEIVEDDQNTPPKN